MITEKPSQAVVRRIVGGYAPDRVILFGACAYGEPTKHRALNLLTTKQLAEAKRSERLITGWRLLRGPELLARGIFVHTPAEVKKAAGISQSVAAPAETQGQLLHAA